MKYVFIVHLFELVYVNILDKAKMNNNLERREYHVMNWINGSHPSHNGVLPPPKLKCKSLVTLYLI